MILFIPPSAAQDSTEADWAAGAGRLLRQRPDCLSAIIGHGRRRKQAHDENHDWIGIRRGLCKGCRKTVTFLPSFSLPYTHYSLIARGQALQRYYRTALFLGRCRSIGERSESSSGCFYRRPLVSQPGFGGAME